MNAQTNSESIKNIMKLTDGYASHLQACNFDDADEFRAALLAAVEELAKDAEAYRTICKRFDVKVDSPVKGQSWQN